MIGEYSILNGRLTYKMPEEIDHHMAKAIAMEIDALIEGGGVRKVVLIWNRPDLWTVQV